MLGKPVPQSVRERISAANIGRVRKPEEILRMLKTKEANGTLTPKKVHGSWKSGWREIGGKRIYARSRWEANYARYLQWLKERSEIIEWEHEPETFWFEAIKRGSRSYLPDFRVTIKSGEVEFHEVKGWMDRRSRTKLKRMKKYHPTVSVRVIDSGWFRTNRVTLQGIIPEWEKVKI